MKNYPIWLLLVLLYMCSGCATILNSSHQKIDISIPQGSKLLVDGEEPEKEDGKYKIKRSDDPTELVLEQEGMMEKHVVIVPKGRSPLVYLPWLGAAAVLYLNREYITDGSGVIGGASALLLLSYLDIGNKAYKYPRSVAFSPSTYSALPAHTDDVKEILLDKVSFDLAAEKIRYTGLSYGAYKRNGLDSRERRVYRSEDEDVEIDNTIFADAINEILLEAGYIDTTNRALKNSYGNNVYLRATVDALDFTFVKKKANLNSQTYFFLVDIQAQWKLMDYYGSEIVTIETNTRSGEFVDDIRYAFKDAIAHGLSEVFQDPKIQQELNNTELAEEAYEVPIILPEAKAYVSNLNEAVASSVTIKSTEGHGSGFIISETGHIITNYHVIADTGDYTVVMNDGTEHDVEILRVSRVADLALLKIDQQNLLPFLISDQESFMVGEEIYAVGTPSSSDLSQTVSKGIISGLRKTEYDSKLIQTDASINSGNSGGPIVTPKGLVLGVVSAKLKGFGVEGVSFGVPSYEILDRLLVRQP